MAEKVHANDAADASANDRYDKQIGEHPEQLTIGNHRIVCPITAERHGLGINQINTIDNHLHTQGADEGGHA